MNKRAACDSPSSFDIKLTIINSGCYMISDSKLYIKLLLDEYKKKQ